MKFPCISHGLKLFINVELRGGQPSGPLLLRQILRKLCSAQPLLLQRVGNACAERIRIQTIRLVSSRWFGSWACLTPLTKDAFLFGSFDLSVYLDSASWSA